LDAITTGDGNTAIGYAAMDAITTGANNVAVGFAAMSTSVDDADYNVAVGYYALGTADVSGDYNIAIGYTAGENITSAIGNILIGREAGSDITTQGSNVMIGHHAGNSAECDYGTHVGYAAGYNDHGNSNTFIGYQSGAFPSITGAANTAVGKETMMACTSGGHNAVLGRVAVSGLTEGMKNVIIGAEAGTTGTILTTGDYNTIVGYAAHTSAADSNNQIVLGDQVTGNADDSFCFGQGSSDSAIANGATTITAPSDIRLKEDIQDEVVGLDFINELRPVTFRWRKAKDVPSEMKVHSDSEERVMNGKYNHGFISQEVKEVIDNNPNIKEGFDMWTEDEADGRQRIGESALIPMLVKSIQELTARIEELKGE
jgi:hypothetical protein